MTQHSRGLALMTLVGAVTLSGCSSHGSARQVHLPEKDRAHWVLPLDTHEQSQVDLPGIAANLIVKECLGKRGWLWHASTAEVGARPGDGRSASGRRIFDLAVAEKYGYGTTEILDLPIDVIKGLDADYAANNALPVSAEPDIEACWERADDELGIETDEDGDEGELASDLAGKAYEAGLASGKLAAASASWRRCMSTVGVPDLPQTPDLMPPRSLEDRSGPAIDAPPTYGGHHPTHEERRVATADAKCRESSGYAEAVYNAEWDEQVKELSENADALERYDKQMQKINRRAEKVIADYVPSSP